MKLVQLLSAALIAIATVTSFPSAARAGGIFGERAYEYELSDALPGATEFVRKDTYWEGFATAEDTTGEPLGYVFLTDDLVDTPGYSGHTLNTLVGIDGAGKITGVQLVRHSEPIVLIGLSEQVMHQFVGQYAGRDIRDRIIISETSREGHVTVDGISGATVTAVAHNATILEAGRRVARAVGIVQASEVRTRRPAQHFQPLTWEQLATTGAIGEVVVKSEEVGEPAGAVALHLRFALLDPPGTGRNLLGERFYKIVSDRLVENGGSALFIGAEGHVSFKGAGFARGGIFDRFSLEQDGSILVFKDVDYINFPQLPGDDAPDLKEGGIFFIESDRFDPTRPFTFHLTVPYRVNDRRTYDTFLADYRLPKEFVEEDVPFWVGRWQSNIVQTAAFAAFLLAVALAFTLRNSLLPHRKLLHYSVAAISVVWLGILLKAQPSMTQVLTLVNSGVRQRFPVEIFLSEPAIFLFWITIVVSLLVWGRGFFCGWLCPYGALLELLSALWQRIGPESIRKRVDAWRPGRVWRGGKYVTFFVILAVGVVNLPLAEMLGEVEPFKTFVLRLARPLSFVIYFIVVTLVSAVSYRFFCRFLCPLGGGLALAGSKPLRELFRYEQCSSCTICYRHCEPQAIHQETGRIDYRECLQCWDCQSTGLDENVCPELIKSERENRAPRFVVRAVLLCAFLGASSAAAPSQAATVVVEPGSRTINQAIAASAPGDTIRVAPGLYVENVVVDKSVTLTGEKGAVISAGGSGNALVVAAPEVVVEGLTLRDCGVDPELSEAGILLEKGATDSRIVGNRVDRCRFGIWIHGAANSVVTDNRVEGIADLPRNERGDCIHLWDGRDVVVKGNTLSHCRDGIYMELSTDCLVEGNTISESRYSVHTMWCDRSAYNENIAHGNLVGLALMFSKQIEAKDNELYDNQTHGILLTQVTRAQVTGNVIVANTKGLFVYNSLYNTIRDNLVARNNLGMHYWGGSEENELTNNTFVGNEIQVKFVAAYDQEWQGNFWSDYVGWDMDGDARGDVAYRSNTLVDSLLWKFPMAKLLLASPALQMLAMAERSFPVITVPKGVDSSPRMTPSFNDWKPILERYPSKPRNYYGRLAKLPHVPGER